MTTPVSPPTTATSATPLATAGPVASPAASAMIVKTPEFVMTANPQSKFDTPNFVAFVETTAKWLSASQFAGVKTIDQGRALAMYSWVSGQHFHEIAARNHVIEGKLSKRPEAMLSDFAKAGGKHRWINPGDDHKAAVLELEWDGHKTQVSYTMEDAKLRGLLPAEGGKPNQWTKMPGEMLRARCTSKAMKMVAPQFCDGLYTPEELEDVIYEERGGASFAPAVSPSPSSSSPPAQPPATSAQVVPRHPLQQPTKAQAEQQLDEYIDAEFTAKTDLNVETEQPPFDTPATPAAQPELAAEPTFNPAGLISSITQAIQQLVTEKPELQGKLSLEIYEGIQMQKGHITAPFTQCSEEQLTKALEAITAKLSKPFVKN